MTRRAITLSWSATCSSSARATETHAAAFCCWARFSTLRAWPSACLKRSTPTRCATTATARLPKGGGSSDLGEFLSGLFRGGLRLQPDFVSRRRRALALPPAAPAARRGTHSDRRPRSGRCPCTRCGPRRRSRTRRGTRRAGNHEGPGAGRDRAVDLALQLRHLYGVSGVVRRHRLPAHALLEHLVRDGARRRHHERPRGRRPGL